LSHEIGIFPLAFVVEEEGAKPEDRNSARSKGAGGVEEQGKPLEGRP